jgi:hypothetical protein
MNSSTAQWHTPNRVIYVKNIGDLTPDDFRAVDKEIIGLMRSAPSTNQVHVIVDCTEMGRMPDVSQLEFGRILKYFQEPRCSWTVIIDNKQNLMLRVGSRILTTMGSKRLQVESSVAAGLTFLRRVDPLFVEVADNAPTP